MESSFDYSIRSCLWGACVLLYVSCKSVWDKHHVSLYSYTPNKPGIYGTENILNEPFAPLGLVSIASLPIYSFLELYDE